MTRVYTRVILESECIGDSLSTINLNFNTLDNNLESLRINTSNQNMSILALIQSLRTTVNTQAAQIVTLQDRITTLELKIK
jgi:hypothetical protein